MFNVVAEIFQLMVERTIFKRSYRDGMDTWIDYVNQKKATRRMTTMARHYKQSESDFYCTGWKKGCPIFRKRARNVLQDISP